LILSLMYDHYQQNPLDMLTPADLMTDGGVTRDELVANIHYLSDRGLVELMLGYYPPLFAAARITPDGIDLVENDREFNQVFPAQVTASDLATADITVLVEQLAAEAELTSLDGDDRRTLHRDVRFLRDELARSGDRQRLNVVLHLLEGILESYRRADEAETLPASVDVESELPVLPLLLERVRAQVKQM
jgi:hypothetical protein